MGTHNPLRPSASSAVTSLSPCMSGITRQPRIMFSTGEVSGDCAASWLAQALFARCPQAELFGVGGSHMAQAGVRVLLETSHLGSVGLTEPMATVPGLLRSFLTLRRAVADTTPDVAVLVGHEIFNWLLAWYLALKKVPTVCFFPPQIWLWGSILRVIAPVYTAILSSFPQEHELYQRSGGQSHFVGHYLCDLLKERNAADGRSARLALGLESDELVVALLPGSRVLEIRQLTPLLLGVARRLREADQRIRFVLPIADRAYAEVLEKQVKAAGLAKLIRLTDDSRIAMQAADLAVMASGTASLEAALLGLPTVVVYRISRTSMFAVRLARLLGLISARFVGLPNLIHGREVVPEFRQHRAGVDRVARKALQILLEPKLKEQMCRDLSLVRPALAGSVERENASDVVLEIVRSVRQQLQCRPL